MPRGLSSQISESSLGLSVGSADSLSATSLGSVSDVFGGSVSLNDFNDIEDNADVDDDALSELIRKLKGQPGKVHDVTPGGKQETDSPSVTAAESIDDAEMEDDLIERHLRALAQSTKTKPNKQKASRPVESEEEEDDDEDIDGEDESYGEEESTVMNDSEAPTWEDVDDSDDAHNIEVYNTAEDLAQKLLGGAKSHEGPDDHKMFLQKMVETSTKYDYGGAPTTATMQNEWLASLAKDLLREDSGSDEESSVGVGQYNQNISNLARASENAKRLMESSAKQQQKVALWREKQRMKQPKFHARKPKQVLQTTHIEAKLAKARSSSGSTVTDLDREAHQEGTAASNFNDIDSVFTPVDRIVPDEFTVQQNTVSVFPTMLDPVAPAAEIVVPIIPKKKTVKSGKTKDLKVIVQAARHARSHVKQDASQEASKKTDTKDRTSETFVDKVEKIKGYENQEAGSQEPVQDKKPLSSQEIAIPAGMPPYPGFGQKWPWHPYSARAPPGYRECYMHHMGDYYFEYMEYLRTRAENGDDGNETTSEKILRHTLRQEAKFKKPKPALSPYTFTAKPGRARENCAVGGVSKMPKIEEGSNSSSGTQASSGTNSFEKKIQKKKTQPDVFTVGKYHPKAKGRKAKIVVVSGAELDQKAKQQQRERKKKIDSQSEAIAVLSSHSAKKQHCSVQEQPHDPVESQCMCTIM